MFYPALILLIYAIITAGRLLAAQAPYRREHFTLATAWCAGYGAYGLWVLAAQPLFGAGPWVTPAAFIFAAAVLAGALYREWHKWPREQHHTAHIAISLLIAAPLLRLIWQLNPDDFGSANGINGTLFWQQAALAKQLTAFAGWPTALQLPAASWPTVPGLLPLLTPLAGLGDIALPPLIPLLANLGSLLAAGGVLLVALNWPVKWSNLPLVAAGSLLAVAVLNPWLPLHNLAAPDAPLFAALCLFTAAAPLFNPLPLPVGGTVLGPALSLAALTLLHPLGWLLSLWVVIVWKIRVFAEGIKTPDHAHRHLLALTLLAALPTLAWAGWQYALHPFRAGITYELGPLLAHPQLFFAVLFAQLPGVLPGHTGPLPLSTTQLLQLCIIAASLWAGLRPIFDRRATANRQLCITCAPLFLPLLLALPPVLLVAWFSPQKVWNILQVQQFVWLVPLAATVAHGYRHSAWRERLFRAPWSYGTACCILLFSIMIFISRPPAAIPSPWPAVAAALRPYPLVLAAGLSPAAVSEMNYYSNGYTNLVPVPESQQPTLMGLLKQQSLPLLATSDILQNLGISATAPAPLLLFQPAPGGVKLLAKWNAIP
jgi:hypothetical protein